MERLYVLTGKARNGKDTVTDILEKLYTDKGKSVLRLSYGAYPKYYVKELFNWDGKDDTKPRELLTEVSMYARKINPNYMIRIMEEDINILKEYTDIIIITDSRMIEEMEMPKEKFGCAKVIKVERPNFQSPLSAEQQTHILETSIDNYTNYDYLITNDSGLDELKEKVENLVWQIESEA